MEKIPVKIKCKPNDFIVEEVGENWKCKILENPIFNIPPNLSKLDKNISKDFLWCEMEKINIDHFQAIKEIAFHLGKNIVDIGYAGTKDKLTHSVQRISIFKPSIENLEKFHHPKIILKNFKWEKRKLKLGYLEENNFKITLRDVDKKDAIKISSKIKNSLSFPNYFGAQRFGIDKSNAKIGKLILKKKFEEALFEINKIKSENAIIVLKHFPRKQMLMFVNSLQSKIFNEILERAIEEEIDFTKEGQKNCLLFGYKSRFSGGHLGEIEKKILKKNDINLSDFDIKEIPYLRIKGSWRKAIIEVKNLSLSIEDDDEFPNSKKIILSFTLPSGAYATTFLENFFELTTI